MNDVSTSNHYMQQETYIIFMIMGICLLFLEQNAQNCIASCRIESIHKDAAQKLVPDLCVPLDLVFHMPEAVNINPQNYLEV